ncbi:class IV adenylate cyclase [Achromobacter xylosoxidans]|jgi:adenylate cyclase class IV|uniref:Class IV adenylate cyclase n=1 Tax=Alcaligenes xylosoxydans xylosoxydans TaxID=85698 RepID=A0A9X3R343_ALCXX|nr:MULTISPECIES: class IV adenylate cyclase [Achromobacter]AMH05345.1 CYTH domain-containing protein [Achromobacter xylosoxidans]AXA76936.1 CYTH domain-containing protein [Achromobacter xylosoxidans]EFV81905.1 adenylate cyclase [Achromobacter xylosoxidans C54]MBK1982775.1 class IV adenylate cyclase [Achromobacter xylosoxidans]MCH1992769.1 class IV adenylate cyclase [Achromobacter xylosoxidans]
MARNIEIKARVASLAAVESLAAALSGKEPVAIAQDDTFFACPDGRLKLRAFSDGTGELIFYRRADDTGPKESFYVISPTSSPDTLRDALGLAYGVIGRVRKQRLLFMAGRTRIHLDRVEGLGEFLELEVVLRDGESAEAGMAEARELLASLRIAPEQLVSGAYLDLLAQRG